MSTPFKMKGWSPFTQKEDEHFLEKEKRIPQEGAETGVNPDYKQPLEWKKVPEDLKDLSKVAYDKLPNNPTGDKERKKRDAELGNIHPKKKDASQKNIIRKKVSKFIDLKRSGDGTIKGGPGFRKSPIKP